MNSQPVPLNRDNWSEASKRSTLYDLAPAQYLDSHYDCGHCKHVTIFSAEAQRQTFEVRKAYIRQGRLLCEACMTECRQLQHQAAQFASRWKAPASRAAFDRSSLEQWLQLLEVLPSYGARRNLGQITALLRALQNAA